MWPRIDDLRTLELGDPGALRTRLNGLVAAGEKTATAGRLAEYEEEGEELERVGERMVLVADEIRPIGLVEITRVDIVAFIDVTSAFSDAEGEGFVDVDHWRRQHRAFWRRVDGVEVPDDELVACIHLRYVGPYPTE